MKTDPILDLEVIKDIAEYLEKESKRNELLVWMLVFTGIRIEDVLKFRVRDFRDERGKILDKININEGKTKKVRRVEITRKLRIKLEEYIKGKPGYEFIFLSRKGNNKPISRQQAWNILSHAGKIFGVRVSPHAFRKTFARRLYEISNNDITVPMRALNHTTPKQTESYIGLAETEVNRFINKLDF